MGGQTISKKGLTETIEVPRDDVLSIQHFEFERRFLYARHINQDVPCIPEKRRRYASVGQYPLYETHSIHAVPHDSEPSMF